VELLISLNPGEPPRGLDQVASGGEASRILLALKAALADRLPYGVMLLDEIEAGLGADSAGKVAAVLRELSQHRQVLAITHLPAVAAAGEQHLLVSKSVSAGRSSVSIAAAEADTRLTEIMRMLGGESRESEGLARRLLAG
jgi:DNA repair protein RecN (Recombination protein N)